MVGSFGVGGSSSNESWNESTNPWAAQDPYLRQGFAEASRLMGMGPYGGPYWVDPNQMQRSAWQGGYGAADPTGVMNRLYGFADLGMGGYEQAMQHYQGGLQGRQFDNPYGSGQYNKMIEENYWNDTAQQMADQMRSNVELDLHRSDFGDRSAGAASGLGGGSDYQIARGLAAGEADRNYKNQLKRLQMEELQRATGIADQWAGQQVQNQMQNYATQDRAADQLFFGGRSAAGDLANAYNFGQQGYQNMAGWGDYAYGFDENEMAGRRQQWLDQWMPLQNYWNVVGAGQWGSETSGSRSSDSKSFSGGFGF